MRKPGRSLTLHFTKDWRLMYQQHQRTKDNQQAVTTSAIVAKALCRRSNGSLEMIVVFAQSTRLEHYWTFRVRSPRSPRRAWKLMGYHSRDLSPHYHDFGSFVAHRALVNNQTVEYIRTPQKRLLASLLKKTAHESIYGDWSPIDPTAAVSLNYVRRRAGYGPRGKRSVWAQ